MNIKVNKTIVCFFAKIKRGGGVLLVQPDSVDELNTMSSSTNDIRNQISNVKVK